MSEFYACVACDGAWPCPAHPNGPAEPTDRDPRSRTYWTAAHLMMAELPEPRWAVPDIVPEGLSLLVGSPKVGKSWAALGLALAVARGGAALGAVDVEEGDVLYLALEDGPRRLRDRLGSLLGGDEAPDRLAFLTRAPRVDEDLVDRLTAWTETVREPRLIVIDVLARVRPPVDGRGSMYNADYAVAEPLQAFATHHGLAVLLVHHTRKAPSDDFLATVSGTHGLAGAADAVLVLTRSRTEADAVLAVTGRDLNEAEHALTFDKEVGAWRMLGDARVFAMSPERRAIVAVVEEAGALKPKAIAARSDVGYGTVKHLVGKMVDAGQLDTDGHGTYLPVHPVHFVHRPGQNGERSERGERPVQLAAWRGEST
jgi:hypothetical protein